MKENIIGLSREALAEKFSALGLEAFRLKQVWQWVYFHGVRQFELMTNLSKDTRRLLEDNFYIGRPTLSRDLHSIDGTRKFLVKFEDGQEVETVHIPTVDRGSLCMSSQVGCSLSCTFCHTGTQKLVRNLSAADIVGQFMVARDAFGEWPSPNEGRLISNIVMMGMGEPLLNYDNVATALKILMDAEGIKLGKRRITLSTAGIVPRIKDCGEDLGVNLAVSLHAVRDELRDELVPINKKWPIAELLEACRKYYGDTNNYRRVTFEYVMLKDVNDSIADAKELARLVKGINAKINIIPFNPWPGAIYECSSDEQIKAFAKELDDAGLEAPVRTPRGRDIMAACGQLKSESVKLNKSIS
jgi:23S rRNA (adenine2503-C2)-methyltransferase